jgi:hypothetical protein
MKRKLHVLIQFGVCDVVVVWRFDRFARSIEQLVLATERKSTRTATTQASIHPCNTA